MFSNQPGHPKVPCFLEVFCYIKSTKKHGTFGCPGRDSKRIGFLGHFLGSCCFVSFGFMFSFLVCWHFLAFCPQMRLNPVDFLCFLPRSYIRLMLFFVLCALCLAFWFWLFVWFWFGFALALVWFCFWFWVLLLFVLDGLVLVLFSFVWLCLIVSVCLVWFGFGLGLIFVLLWLWFCFYFNFDLLWFGLDLLLFCFFLEDPRSCLLFGVQKIKIGSTAIKTRVLHRF